MRNGSTWRFVAGLVLGGAIVALIARRRRRAAMDAAGLTRGRGRGLRQRLRGIVYQTRERLSGEDVPDDILVERIRAQLERPVSHPDAIDVRAQDGCVILAGPILADELDELVRQVASIGGVRSIRSELDLHDEPGNVPALQH